MVSVCLPSDALLQHLPFYLDFSYLGCGVSLQGCSSKAQLLLLTLDEAYLLTATLPDLQHGMAPLGPPVPRQPPLLGRGVDPPGHHPWPGVWGYSSWPPPRPWTWGSSPWLRLVHWPVGLSADVILSRSILLSTLEIKWLFIWSVEINQTVFEMFCYSCH